ncbi:metal ABC transporter permease [Arcanobacterium hippocoleae]
MLAEMFSSALMQRALIISLLVGISAPIIGTYLVQRGLTLLGDGIGHIALTGVALGWLAGNAAGAADKESWAVPGAVFASVLGALIIEWMRERGKASGEVALALIFYGGIAGGVLLIGIAGGSTTNLNGYLFGSISTVSLKDIWLTVFLTIFILLTGFGLKTALFTLCHDPQYARAAGLPVRMLSILISVTAALTVSVAMRVVGVLLVSALMIIPIAAAQTFTKSFRSTMFAGILFGAAVSVTGLSITYFKPWAPGATIVILALAGYLIFAVCTPIIRHIRQRFHPHRISNEITR